MLRTLLFTSFLALLVAMPARAEKPVVLVVGDSLSAAYGIAPERGWVALLAARLADRGYGHRVVNASISGDTTRGGRTRLPRALDVHRPSIVILELGGNDGLRGTPLAEMRRNLSAMVEAVTDACAHVLLAGMRIPPNYGPIYTEKFHRVYHSVAAEHGVALLPFLLEGIALDDALMQSDGVHPNARAQPLILDRVWERLEPLLEEAARCQND